MANPLGIIQNIAGTALKTGSSVVGGLFQTVQGLTGRGGDDDGAQQEQPTRAEQQRQRQKKAATQRRASRQPKDLDDVSITRKVETEIFRPAGVDKGKINVNTADGVVFLRGEVKNPEQVKELEAKAAAIPEVKRVENLLHLPKTPAPTRTDTPAAQRKTRTSKPSQTGRKVSRGRTTAEKQTTSAPKEPAPNEVASTGAGRPAAPLGGDGETEQ
jgi:BON domain